MIQISITHPIKKNNKINHLNQVSGASLVRGRRSGRVGRAGRSLWLPCAGGGCGGCGGTGSRRRSTKPSKVEGSVCCSTSAARLRARSEQACWYSGMVARTARPPLNAAHRTSAAQQLTRIMHSSHIGPNTHT